jgi:uncharacterized damage-inducible protein DinB
MDGKALAASLRAAKEHFDRSTRCLTEEHAGFRPVEGMMTVAQQVAHVAQDIDWFREGAFRPEGFDMDFEAHKRALEGATSLKEARDWADRAFDAMAKKLESCSVEDLTVSLAPGAILGGMPRAVIVGAMIDHTAHHRGALTVYSRLLGLTPAMPYLEESPA